MKGTSNEFLAPRPGLLRWTLNLTDGESMQWTTPSSVGHLTFAHMSVTGPACALAGAAEVSEISRRLATDSNGLTSAAAPSFPTSTRQSLPWSYPAN